MTTSKKWRTTVATGAIVLLTATAIAASEAKNETYSDEFVEACWADVAALATRTSTAPRLRGADAIGGEGTLEAFGTRYLPNAYDAYQKARATAKEREQVLTDNFPDGRSSDSTGGALFDKVSKACANAVAEMFRRHDELAHLYLMHECGAVTDAELSGIDASPPLFALPGEENWEYSIPAEFSKRPTELSESERNFAEKYLPETWSAWKNLDSVLEEGKKGVADVRGAAVAIDATRGWAVIVPLRERLSAVIDEMDKLAALFKQQRLLHSVGETTISELAGIDASKRTEMDRFIATLPASAWVHPAVSFAMKYNLRQQVTSIPYNDMVQIPGKHYFVEKYEVTQKQWRTLMDTNPSEGMRLGGDLPVEVSWNDCQEFIKRLNALPSVKMRGLTFRLPTEEEWVFACLAGRLSEDYGLLADGTRIKKETLDRVAWFSRNSDYKIHPVGQKEPNAFGLYDMHGNVWEWTQTAEGDYRISRGGDYHSSHDACSGSPSKWASKEGVSWRQRCYPDSNSCGFRLCADETEAAKEARQAREEKRKEEAEKKVEETRKEREARLLAEEPWSQFAELPTVLSLPGGESVRFCACPAGSFTTESQISEPSHEDDKKTNEVTLTHGFLLGETEVTQTQWESVMGKNPSSANGADLPVHNVSWNDCQKFIKKINALASVKASGLTFRLPTKEEWEFACRAGATDDYCRLPDGTEITSETLGRVAWFENNSDNQIHPVRQKEPNAFGLYDMNGNVWEWTQTAKDGDYRAAFGGNAGSGAGECGPSAELWLSRSYRHIGLGFRLCASGRATD